MSLREDPTLQMAEGLRALADPTRLRIVALLGRRPHYGEELAEFLQLTPATISHHVKTLRIAGLIEARREPPYVLLHLVAGAIASLTTALLETDLDDRFGLPPESELAERTLRRFLNEDEQVTEVPSGRRLRATLLRWVASHLESDRLYAARELRLVLLDLAEDPDLVREALVEQGWLKQSGSVYRRVEEVDAL